jgi:hypothetical protein
MQINSGIELKRLEQTEANAELRLQLEEHQTTKAIRQCIAVAIVTDHRCV